MTALGDDIDISKLLWVFCNVRVVYLKLYTGQHVFERSNV